MAKLRTPGRSSLDVDDVLAGRTRPSGADLLDLIHRENPTGRALGAREVEARYARKSRLQSLLVRRFGAELTVVADREGTVSLRLGTEGRDACHAVIDSLDEDARAWVRLQLDLGASGDAPPPARPREATKAAKAARATAPGDETPESLLQRAGAALEEYDFEMGRALLERAVSASGGGPDAARALLGLLVETLGDDAAALGAEAALSRASLADAEVRGLLALAAARAGEEDRAATFARGAHDDRAAATFAALAAGAIAAGDLARAAAHLDRARKLDPASPALAAVEAEVGKARAAQRGPAEAEIAALLAAGRDDEAQRAAEAVLSRWSDSEAARRALRTLEDRRRRATTERLVAEAEAALSAGALPEAARLLRAAAATAGKEGEALHERAVELEARERARRDAEHADAVLARLEAGDLRAGLLAYAELSEGAQARVRERAPRPEIAALDQSAGARVDVAARIDAVLALAQARTLAEGDLAAAQAALAPHADVLERIPEARRLQREIAARLTQARVAQARARVTAARAALAAGAAEGALAQLDAATIRDLTGREREEAEEARAAAERLAERRRRAAEIPRQRAAGRLFEARAIAEQLGEGAAGEERARWEAERGALQAEIQRDFQVEVDGASYPATELSPFRPAPERSQAPRTLTADGRSVVIAETHERWLVLRVLDVETSEVRPTVLLRTPEPLDAVDVTVAGQTVWILGARGALLTLSRADWAVRDFRPASEHVGAQEVVEQAELAFGEGGVPRHLWLSVRPLSDDLPERVRVIDLAQRRAVREVREVDRMESLPGLVEPRMLAHGQDGCSLYLPRGAAAPGGKLNLPWVVQGAAPDAEGRGLVVMVGARIDDVLGEDDARPHRIGLVSPSGALGEMLAIEETNGDLISAVAATRGDGQVFATVLGPEGTELHAFTAREGKVERLWSAPVPSDTTMVQDLGATQVVALVVHDRGAELRRLGGERPSPLEAPPHPQIGFPGNESLVGCGRPGDLPAPEAMDSQSTAVAIRIAKALEVTPDVSAERLLGAAIAVADMHYRDAVHAADEMTTRLLRRFPEHPRVRIFAAERHVRHRRWAEVDKTLAGVDFEELPERERQHVHHLRAIAAMHEVRPDDLEREVRLALELDGECMLNQYADLLDPGRRALDDWPLGRLLDAVGRADACLEREDATAAIAALDIPETWRAKDPQSLARLAEAYLRGPEREGRERVRKVVMLGAFLDVLDDRAEWDRPRMTVVRGAWSEARVAEVAARARAWLAGTGREQGTVA